jgi:hypothetical protein
MTDAAFTPYVGSPEVVPIRWGNLAWVAAAVVVMVVAIALEDIWLLNFVHVFSSVVWTGVDLFMGFVLGPVLRRVDPTARRAIVGRLVPRTLFLMPTLALVSTTTGWFLAEQEGFLDLEYPELWWLVAALAIAGILTVQGLAVLLPVNLRIYREFRERAPDLAKINRLMRLYIAVVASQGVMQVLIVLVMARFATGL